MKKKDDHIFIVFNLIRIAGRLKILRGFHHVPNSKNKYVKTFLVTNLTERVPGIHKVF